jgi:protein disulfide-isomerase
MFKTVFVLLMLILVAAPLRADEVMMEGAKPGKWTMDFDAALALAKEKDVPIFLKFTGSNWCKWCILMEDNVFNKPQWPVWAKDKLVLVTLDFPRPNNLPSELAQRNQMLAQQMGVQGFPTYIILDSDGATNLGQLSAGTDKTAESFIAEVKSLIKFSNSGVKAFASELAENEADAYLDLFDQRRQLEQEQAEYANSVGRNWGEEQIAKMREFDTQISSVSDKLRAIEIEAYAGKLSNADENEYRILNSRLKALQAELSAWLSTQPERTPENTKKYQKYQVDLQNLAAEIGQYEQ